MTDFNKDSVLELLAKRAPGNFSGLFEGYKGTKLDLSWMDTSNVKTMNRMFYNCPNLEFLDISSFDTTGVEDMHYMFWECPQLQFIKLGKKFCFKGSQVYDASRWAFLHCRVLAGSEWEGGWIHESGKYGPFEWTQMVHKYKPEMAGTWCQCYFNDKIGKVFMTADFPW